MTSIQIMALMYALNSTPTHCIQTGIVFAVDRQVESSEGPEDETGDMTDEDEDEDEDEEICSLPTTILV